VRVQLIRASRDDGAVAIVAALLAVALLLFVAFATDFGLVYSHRQALSTGVDSASLAVVRAQYKQVLANPTTATCAQLVAADAALAAGDPAKSSTIALAQLNANAPFGEAVPAASVTTSLTCVGTGSGTLLATVSVTKPVQTVFGRFAGISTISVSPEAAAALGAAREPVGYKPIGVCADQALQIVANAAADVPGRSSTYRHELITIDKTWGGASPCGEANGNWGWLDCDGSGESAVGNGLRNGCRTGLTIDTSTTPPTYTASGTPGNKGNGNPVVSAFSTIMDDVVAIPVYDVVSGNGNNANYHVVGFLSVRICGYRSNNQVAGPGMCYVTNDPLVTPNVANNVALVDNSLQVQYAGYTPVAELNTECPIGDVDCAFNVYVTELVE
jgi:Flp pilus assembly protein TadG